MPPTSLEEDRQLRLQRKAQKQVELEKVRIMNEKVLKRKAEERREQIEYDARLNRQCTFGLEGDECCANLLSLFTYLSETITHIFLLLCFFFFFFFFFLFAFVFVSFFVFAFVFVDVLLHLMPASHSSPTRNPL